MNEVSLMPSGWCLFPSERFESATVMDLHAMVNELRRDYRVEPPKGVDVMLPLALRDWIRENASTAEVWGKHQKREREELFSTFYTETQRGEVIPDTENIAEYLLESQHIVSYESSLYAYREGIYERNNGFIESKIQDILNEIGFKGRIITATNQILHRLTFADPSYEYPFNSDPDVFPVRNGVLKIDWNTGEIKHLPHSHEFKNLYKLPVDYSRDADSTGILAVFKAWVGKEDVDILLQFIAQCLLQSKNLCYKKAYLFEGGKDAAKSTFYDLFNIFLGEKNVSHVDLHRICTDEFSFGSMEGKLANFQDDLEAIPLKSVGRFKELTGTNKHHIVRKHHQGYDGIINAVQAYNCNIPPKGGKVITDDAFWGRWEYVIFPNKFEKNDRFFSEITTDGNLSGLLNEVLRLMVEIRRAGHLVRDSDPQTVKKRWIGASENLSDFYHTEIQEEKGGFIPVSKFYAGYVKYCSDKGLNIEGKSRVSTLLRTFAITSEQKKIEGKSVWVYPGIKWIETSEYKPDKSENNANLAEDCE